MYLITCKLENIGDLFEGIADVIVADFATPIKSLPPPVMDIYGKVLTLFEAYYDLFYKYSIDKLVVFKKQYLEIKGASLQHLGSQKGAEIKVVHYLLDINEALNEMTETLPSL